MPKSLESIKGPVKKELIQFESHFKDSMKSQVALLDKIMYYIIQRKGKQIRPMFVFLSAKMFSDKIDQDTYTAASLIEILHTASLVHDDVVDDAHLRRGFFSVSALWKNKVAVLVGDHLLVRGLTLALDTDQIFALKAITKAFNEITEGELLQIEKARKLDIKEDIYYDIIRKKTASLMAAACSAGAYSTTKDLETSEKMKSFGEKVGIAYQIRDDLFDYGEGGSIGKPKGIDIKERKMTLPLIHVLNQADRKTKRFIIDTVKNHNKNAKRVKEVINLVKENGGLDYASKVMINYKNEALDLLEQFPASPAKTSLIDLVNFAIDRKK